MMTKGIERMYQELCRSFVCLFVWNENVNGSMITNPLSSFSSLLVSPSFLLSFSLSISRFHLFLLFLRIHQFYYFSPSSKIFQSFLFPFLVLTSFSFENLRSFLSLSFLPEIEKSARETRRVRRLREKKREEKEESAWKKLENMTLCFPSDLVSKFYRTRFLGSGREEKRKRAEKEEKRGKERKRGKRGEFLEFFMRKRAKILSLQKTWHINFPFLTSHFSLSLFFSFSFFHF